MRLVVSVVLAAASATLASAHPRLKALEGDNVTITAISLGSDKTEIQRLRDEGYDIAGVDLDKGTVDILTSGDEDKASLRMLGFKIAGSRRFDTRFAPDEGYKTPQEVTDLAATFARNYPQLVRVESIGKTGENRDIWALKITSNPDDQNAAKPRILFNAMHHAREVMTTEIAFDIAEYLVGRHGTDPVVTRWVDDNEIWIVPQVNPDGSNKVWTGSSMWRKNARGGYGVDINRNYPYAWNTCRGSSGSTFADDYRGPSAGSEPETQALMALVSRIQPVFDISFHSYSELVLFPYGCNGEHTDQHDMFTSIGNEMANLLPRESGNGKYTPGTPWEILYAVDGGDIDWMYHEHGVMPFVIEVNSSGQGFQPPYRVKQPTVEKMRAAWGLLMNKLEQSGVRGRVTDAEGHPLADAVVTIAPLAKNSRVAAVTRAVKRDATYHQVLSPGMYKVTVRAGERSFERDVTVGADRVDLDVSL